MAAAGIAVSISMGVMKPVLEKLSTLMGDEYKKIKGLRKEVSFLRDELCAMDALLEKMDAADRLDSQAKEWRRDIIEMSYDIEDCLDDFMHRVGGDAGNKVGLLQKASGFLRTIKDRYRIANQIKKIKTRVIQTSNRRERYKFDVCISNTTLVVADPRLSLYNDSTTLVGIDTQKEELSKWVNDEDQQLKIMSIVGFGGLGKTTLANEVYRQVEGRFNCKALVCVSQKPDITKLLKRIMFELGLPQYSHDCFVEQQDLVRALRKHLQDKRYFIVVDDLWEMEAWDAIRCAFPQNNYCSRVMITTRNEKVAERCCGSSGIIHNMKPLSELDSRKLFFTRIFGSPDGCPSGFEEVSCAILKRCGGLPLAIITIAGILAFQQTKLKEAWEYIETALAPELESNIDYEKMMYILDLSYKHLPRHLKACFLYLGTYPEDHIINKAELVTRWVAEGFVSASPQQNIWDVAESYLNELVNRSMIQPAIDEDDELDYRDDELDMFSGCRVHDMMLDLILRKCKEDNFLTIINEPEAMAAVKDKVIRRLTVDLTNIYQGGPMLKTTAAGKLSHARSVTMFTVSSWSIPLLLELKFVRVLEFSSIGHEMGVDISSGIINRLSHLRYLKVKGYNNMVLPVQIRGLRLLETLYLSEFPNGISSLDLVDVPRLSHLEMPSGTRLPSGIAETKQLRTLRGISLSTSSSESIEGLGELTGLTELSLHSDVPRTATWMVSFCTCLEKLGKLRLLEVQSTSCCINLCADPLSLLSPPFGNSLERLRLHFLTFTKVPRWVGHLQCLQDLLLGAKQIFQEDVAIIGMLPNLIRLHLRIVHVPTTRIVIGGAGLFTLVKVFSFNCDGISSLTFEAGAMPSLGHLNLVFNIEHWDRAPPEGLQHLQGLQGISVHRTDRTTFVVDEDDYEDDFEDDDEDYYDEHDAAVMSVFQETMDAFLTCPVLTYDAQELYSRLGEEED